MSNESISGIEGSPPGGDISLPPPPPRFDNVPYPYGIPDWIMDHINANYDETERGITYRSIYDTLAQIIGVPREVTVQNGENEDIEEQYEWETLGAQISELKQAFDEIQNDYTFGPINDETGELDGTFCAQNWCGFEAYEYYLRSASRNIQVATQFLKEAKEIFSQMSQLMENSRNLPSSQMAIQFQSLLTRLGSLKSQAETSIKNLTKVPVIGDDNLLRWEYEPPRFFPGGTLESLRAESFSNLNLLDKIKYISAYYELDSSPKTFPEDYRDTVLYKGEKWSVNRGFPSPGQEAGTKELGAMESFYVTFLIDRDSPINAFATFMETKVQALRAQVQNMTKNIEFYSSLMKVLNDALQELNSGTYKADSGGDAKEHIPEKVHAVAAYFLRHPTRFVKDSDGNSYFLLQYDDG
ncbi:MAG: hypothetical protein LBR62_01090, partial [Puniceicoccales bacterium]|nr:hypothetical protein [Puniceicoccales bacterium]